MSRVIQTEPTRVVGAFIEKEFSAGRHVLMARRPSGDPSGGLWEFPGGKVEVGEADDEALARELLEEMAAAVVVKRCLAEVVAPVAGATSEGTAIRLVCYEACLVGDAIPAEHDAMAWVPRGALGGLPMPPADVAALELIEGRPGRRIPAVPAMPLVDARSAPVPPSFSENPGASAPPVSPPPKVHPSTTSPDSLDAMDVVDPVNLFD